MTNSRHHTSAHSPEFALLGFLEQSSAHGYELHRRLVEELGEILQCSTSQTYNILTRLEAHGFIKGKIQTQKKRPDKRELRLTPSGREHFETWLGELSACSVHAIRVEFMTRLYFLHARNAQSAIQMVGAQTTALKKYLEQLNDEMQKIPENQVFNRLGMSLRISQLGRLIPWLEICKNQLPIHILEK